LVSAFADMPIDMSSKADMLLPSDHPAEWRMNGSEDEQGRH